MIIQRWKSWARTLKRESVALYLAARDPRTPWYAKAVAVFIVGYVLSPIDLIPDLIPVLGYLDELVLIPLGIWFVRRLIPATVLVDSRAAALAHDLGEKTVRIGRVGAIMMIGLWVLAIGISIWGGFVLWARWQ